ncbi:hypothetical protein Pmani_017569 [Petrolisthes manimaculis]|uniref:Uncharacterized protein n=1 Tax=Petrolisthes manimaculis TaxID=1843537 RepID=A0AAE1PM48_9EUCA|nr:hypothetical protein Pmani_017569 [Petrolisthes manimaculis]
MMIDEVITIATIKETRKGQGIRNGKRREESSKGSWDLAQAGWAGLAVAANLVSAASRLAVPVSPFTTLLTNLGSFHTLHS